MNDDCGLKTVDGENCLKIIRVPRLKSWAKSWANQPPVPESESTVYS